MVFKAERGGKGSSGHVPMHGVTPGVRPWVLYVHQRAPVLFYLCGFIRKQLFPACSLPNHGSLQGEAFTGS